MPNKLTKENPGCLYLNPLDKRVQKIYFEIVAAMREMSI